jgi:Tol biopolymer transport system component
MKRFELLALTLALFLFGAVSPAWAQFGQNKITYEQFEWKVYESPHFDVHYYDAEEPFLEDVVSYAESAYLKLSKAFDHELRWRIPLIMYKTHAEFQQTNIQMREIGEGTLAFAEPAQNRMVLPIDVPPDFLYALITHELTHIFQFSFLFEGNLGRVLRSNPPAWFMEGLASYMADDESNIDKMVIRDAVVNNVLPPVQALEFSSFFAYRFGHAIFDFIEQEHGQEGLRNFIFEYRKVLLANNIPKAVEESFGYDIDEFNRRFNRYLRKKYFPVLLEKKSPDDYGKEIGLQKRGVFTFAPSLSPSGELIAALSSPRSEVDLVVLSAENGELVKNVTKGWTNKYQYLVSESFSGKHDLSWSPVGDKVAVFARKENKRRLLVYHSLTGKLLENFDLDDIVQGASPTFSPDGRRVAFEGNRNGTVDVFEYDLESGEIRNLTQDDQFDANPRYSRDGKTLMYNRRIGPHWKIFAVDLSDPSRKTQITFGPSSDIQPSLSGDGKTVYFASDRGPYGVFNIHSLDLETGALRQYTDVVGGCFAPQEMAERDGETQLVMTAYFEGSFRLYRMPVRQPEAEVAMTERMDAAEAAPFEPPLQLTVDEQKKNPYKVRWDVDVPLVSLGVADDGTFLSNVVVQFTDLLGDQRVQVLASSVDTYSNMNVTYLNAKRRGSWGASIFDYRDYFVTAGTFSDRDQIQRTTGASFFAWYPFNRHYRVESSVGLVDQSQDFLARETTTGRFFFQRFSDRFAYLNLGLVGDTTRYQSWGPFQGKRFRLGVQYASNLTSDFPNDFQDPVTGDPTGDIIEYNLDFRAYKQLTRRSSLAWRLSGIWSAGDRVNIYSMGGINQLRGWDYRDFFGSRLGWSNLELRFPLVDEMRFPFLGIRNIRGFLFVDVGAAWLEDDLWFDPELRGIRVDPFTGEPIPFKFWDSENDRFQDGRGSYGFGFQFFFLGGLQFNWAWSERLDYTRYVPVFDDGGFLVDFTPTEAETGGRRLDFYIVFDF